MRVTADLQLFALILLAAQCFEVSSNVSNQFSNVAGSAWRQKFSSVLKSLKEAHFWKSEGFDALELVWRRRSHSRRVIPNAVYKFKKMVTCG